MSDLQALHSFLRKPVSSEMIQFLVATTNAVISVAPSHTSSQSAVDYATGLPTPPGTPPRIPSLHCFIERLVKYSHVPTSTLMSTLVYLQRLREILPPNSVGMETTRHRIFLGSLILAAKNLNDSSPLNKHWCKYTDGLLSLRDVNALELEMIDYLGWDHLRIAIDDLIGSFAHFLEPIKWRLRHEAELQLARETETQAAYVQGTCAGLSPLDSPSGSPTQPLFTRHGSAQYIPSPAASHDISSMSVPSLAYSSSTSSSSTTISSGLTTPRDSAPSSRGGSIVNIEGVNLKPLKLKTAQPHNIPFDDKENLGYSRPLHVVNPDACY